MPRPPDPPSHPAGGLTGQGIIMGLERCGWLSLKTGAPMKLITARLALCLAFACSAGGASAQEIGMQSFEWGMSVLDADRVNSAIAPPRGSRSRPAASMAPSGARVTTSYRTSPAVSARVKAQYIQFIERTVSPSAAAGVRQVLSTRNPVSNWSSIVAGDGLRAGDAADALAAYWVLNWMIANGGDNNPAQTLAVRDQVRGIMSSNPAFARLDEAQRQEMAEALMLNFLMQHAAFTDAMQRRDQATLRRLGDAAVARFRNEMGVDLRQLQLTNAGFVKRG